MGLTAAVKSTTRISWKPVTPLSLPSPLISPHFSPLSQTGTLQQTLAHSITKSGVGLHSGNPVPVTLCPELAGKGRYFEVNGGIVGVVIDRVVPSMLCTAVGGGDGVRVRTVEHVVSALEATGVDNCRVEISGRSGRDRDLEVPILDGSSKEWVESIEQTGLEDALDRYGNVCERIAPFINEALSVCRDDSFVAAFPSPDTRIPYGINFPQRFIKGGSVENAIICRSLCRASKGWLNPPLCFADEPCRHKVLDLIRDLSLFARGGSRGIPVAHIIAYKAGHSLHADFVRCLSSSSAE